MKSDAVCTNILPNSCFGVVNETPNAGVVERVSSKGVRGEPLPLEIFLDLTDSYIMVIFQATPYSGTGNCTEAIVD